jgi:hypothetical protein
MDTDQIFHLADDDALHPEAPLAQVQRAAWFCAYQEAHARRIYGCAESLPQRLAAALAQRLRSGALGKRFSLRDLYLPGWAGI